MSSPHPRSVLETDFPLMTPPNPPAGSNPPGLPSSVPAAGSYGQARPSYQQYRYQRNSQTASTSGYTSSSSLQRSTQPQTTTPVGYRPLSAYLNTSSSYNRSISQPQQQQQQQQQQATEWQYQSASGSNTTGRSGSLRRAYEEENTTEENQPLFPKDKTNPTVVDAAADRPSPQRSQISSTTSDYHSDNLKDANTTGQIDQAKKEPIEQALIRSNNSGKKSKKSSKMR